MSRLARVLILGAVMAAMNLAGMTAVAQAQSAHDDAVQRFRQGERASQEQPTTDNPTPAPAPLQPPEQTGQPGWLVAALAALAATLAVVAGLAVLAARRATRRARIGPAT
jgi:ferric-dicitrate binding protein FerR (iron transport regulator)